MEERSGYAEDWKWAVKRLSTAISHTATLNIVFRLAEAGLPHKTPVDVIDLTLQGKQTH